MTVAAVSRRRELLGALVVYLMLALLLTYKVWDNPLHRWVGICCDQEQTMWFLAWLPTAVEHGQNPLLTDRLNAPDGVNLMWNSSSSLLAAVAAPVTRTAGPVLAYNLLVVAAIALNGLAAFVALRRYAGPLGALVGGSVYALSPYVASHATLHLNLINAWTPPLFLILLDELFVRRARRPELLGVGLGILGGVQLLIFEEVLATSAIAGLALAVVLLAMARDRAALREAIGRGLRAVVPGVASFLLIAGFPLMVQFLGPQQLGESVQNIAVFSTDLLNLVLPTRYTLIAPDAATAISHEFTGLYHEATGYVGLPLLVVLAAFVVVRRRDARVAVAAAMAVAMLVASLGPKLWIGGEPTGIPLPWALVGGLPLIEHALPARLTVYMDLAIAGLVALAIDHALTLSPGRSRLALAAVAIALVAIVPAPAFSATHDVPAFFRDWERQGIADDDTILFAPWFTNGAGADPMLWAAVAEARPRMREAYAYVPDDRGRPRYGPDPGRMGRLMMRVQDDGAEPVFSDDARREVLGELRDWGIDAVIVGPLRYRTEMVGLFTGILGEPPEERDGVQLWRDVDERVAELLAGG